MDAVVNNERNKLQHQNRAMRELLSSRSLDYQLDNLDLTNRTLPAEPGMSRMGAAEVDVRYDPEVGHERTFLDLMDVDFAWPSSDTTSGDEATILRDPHEPPVAGDSWAALDFILALEWPCKDHVHHPVIQ